MFQKGHKPKPGPGRPKGSKDKSYLTLQYWYDQLMKDWDKVTPAQRMKTSAQLMQMLTNKMKQLPSSPEQSVINAKEAQELLNEIEGKKEETNPSESSFTPKPPEPLK